LIWRQAAGTIPGMAKKPTLSESLRAALKNSPETRYQISRATGISQAQLSRFLHGKVGLTLANLDLLCNHLGVQIVGPDKKGK
jgi:transcriptional regulator with XRE-family HTH domain